MVNVNYYYLQDIPEHEFSADVPRGTSIVRPGSCKACGFVPVGIAPKSPLPVRPEHRRMRSMFSGTTWGFCVIHDDLVAAMGDEVLPYLLFGTMVTPNGARVEKYRTVRAIEQVVMRDSANSVHRVCDLCGALRYTGWPGDAPYVMSWNLKSQAPVYEVEGESLLVREDVRARIGNRWSDVIRFHPVPVLDMPRDGLPAELDIIPTAKQLAGYRPNASTRTSTLSG